MYFKDDENLSNCSIKVQQLWITYLQYKHVISNGILDDLVADTEYEFYVNRYTTDELFDRFVTMLQSNEDNSKSLQHHINWFKQVIDYFELNQYNKIQIKKALLDTDVSSLDLFELMD